MTELAAVRRGARERERVAAGVALRELDRLAVRRAVGDGAHARRARVDLGVQHEPSETPRRHDDDVFVARIAA